MIVDEVRARGNIRRGVSVCSEKLRAKAGGGESLTHTRWIGEMGCPRRGKWRRVETSETVRPSTK